MSSYLLCRARSTKLNENYADFSFFLFLHLFEVVGC